MKPEKRTFHRSNGCNQQIYFPITVSLTAIERDKWRAYLTVTTGYTTLDLAEGVLTRKLSLNKAEKETSKKKSFGLSTEVEHFNFVLNYFPRIDNITKTFSSYYTKNRHC